LGWCKSKDYWRKVEAKIGKQKEAIRIKKAKVAEIEEALEYPNEGPWRNRLYYEFVNGGPVEHYESGGEPRVEPNLDGPYDSIHEYAREVYKLELAEGERKGMRRGMPTPPLKFQGLSGKTLENHSDFHKPEDRSNPTFGLPDFSARSWDDNDRPEAQGLTGAIGAWRQLEVLIDAGDWSSMTVNAMPQVSPEFEPLLTPQRRGRKPIGERAMSSTERSRKHRNKINEEAVE
jgi:hypothetical protein